MSNVDLIFNKLKPIKAFFFDVDGVMTDGSVIASENGDFLRTFNIKDGYALQHAVKSGYIVAIISGGNSKGVIRRFEQLGIKDIYVGQQNKQLAFEEIIQKYNLKMDEIAYMGDDMPDYNVMQKAGLAICPSDAAIDIQSICHYISPFKGGQGCVRDILEKAMKLHEKWSNEDSHTW